MLKQVIAKLTGVSEERRQRLKNEIRCLLEERAALKTAMQQEKAAMTIAMRQEKTALEETIRQIKQSKELLQQQALKIRDEKPYQAFLVGDARYIGSGEQGLIYEIRVAGVILPIRFRNPA